MGRKYKIDEIIRILAEAKLPNNTIAGICRKYGISENTFYVWRRKYGNLNKDEAKKLKALEEENRALKKLLAEKELEIQTLREILKENF